MDVIFYPSKLSGTVGGISSKSHLHRLLFCSALSDKKTEIHNISTSNDILSTINAVKFLGKSVIFENNVLTICGNNQNINQQNKSDEINIGESGTTLRFLLPIIASLQMDEKNIKIRPTGTLKTRIISPLIDVLNLNGAKITHSDVFAINGNLKSGIFKIKGDISSQFISGLMFALPLCEGDSEIVIEGNLESTPYIDMTISCLEKFGISILHKNRTFFVKGCQKFVTPNTVFCENDWSNAAFFLAAGAIGENFIGVENLNLQSIQGDRQIESIIEKFNATKQISSNKLQFKRNNLTSCDVCVSDFPDLTPVIALIATVSSGTTKIFGASRLKYKESDRLKSISETLNALGANVQIGKNEDSLLITGKKVLKGGTINSQNDHRIAMMASISSIVCQNNVTIKNFEAVNKSYPNFLEDFKKLGGKFTIS